MNRRFVSSLAVALVAFGTCAGTVLAEDANRAAVLSEINALLANISTMRADRSANLLEKATLLSTRYDQAVSSANITADDVDILLQARRLTSVPFRQNVSQQYQSLMGTIFVPIDATAATLTNLKADVTLGYSTVTDAQRAVFETTLSGASSALASFSGSSRMAIDNFYATQSASLSGSIAAVQSAIATNSGFLTTIKNVQRGYGTFEQHLGAMKTSLAAVKANILGKLQNNLTFLQTQKNALAARMTAVFDSAIAKAQQYPRLAERTNELNAYRDVLVNRFRQVLDTTYHDDQDLLLSYLKGDNILASEAALRAKIYTASGTIRYDEVFSTSDSILADIVKLDKDVTDTTAALAAIQLRYANGDATTVTNNLTAALENTYQQKLSEYQAEFQRYVENLSKTETANEAATQAENQANALKKARMDSMIEIMTLKKSLFDTALRATLSADFALKTADAFSGQIAVASEGGDSRVLRVAQQLRADAYRQVVDKTLLDDAYVPYVRLRATLIAATTKALAGLEARVGKDAVLDRMKTVLGRIDARLASASLTTSVRYQLLVVKRTILDYMSKN